MIWKVVVKISTFMNMLKNNLEMTLNENKQHIWIQQQVVDDIQHSPVGELKEKCPGCNIPLCVKSLGGVQHSANSNSTDRASRTGDGIRVRRTHERHRHQQLDGSPNADSNKIDTKRGVGQAGTISPTHIPNTDLGNTRLEDRRRTSPSSSRHGWHTHRVIDGILIASLMAYSSRH